MTSQAEQILSGSPSGSFQCVWYPPQQFPKVLIAENQKNIPGKLPLNTSPYALAAAGDRATD